MARQITLTKSVIFSTTSSAMADGQAAWAREQGLRLQVIPHLLDEFIECLDRWKNLNAICREPSFDELQVIHAARNVCTEWRELVDNRVEYHALRLAEMQAYLAYAQGWLPYHPLIVSGFLENVVVLQKNQVGVRGLGQHLQDASLKELKTEELQQIRDVLAAS